MILFNSLKLIFYKESIRKFNYYHILKYYPSDEPELSLLLKSDEEISDHTGQIALEIVKKIFNPDFDLRPFYDDIKSDKILSKIVPKLKGLKRPITTSVFEAMVSTIIEQQISLFVAKNSERKIIKRFGSNLKRE